MSNNHVKTCRYCQKSYEYNPGKNWAGNTRGTYPEYCSAQCRKADLTKPCAHCNKLFYDVYRDPSVMRQVKYCSTECRTAFHKTLLASRGVAIRSKWDVKHCEMCGKLIDPMDMKFSGVGNYQKTRFCSCKCSAEFNSIKTTTPCPVCGKLFHAKWKKRLLHNNTAVWRKQKYCSLKCRRDDQKHQVAKRLRPCKACKKMFDPKQSKVPSNYCSRKCQWTDMKGAYLGTNNHGTSEVIMTCLNCGYDFSYKLLASMKKNGYFRKYCSKDCYKQSQRKQRETLQYYCVTCGKLIQQKSLAYRPLYCCRDCVPQHRLDPDQNIITRIRVCKNCQKPFKAENDHQWHCSAECFLKNLHEDNDEQ